MNLGKIKKSIMYRLRGGAYVEEANKRAMQKPDVAEFYETHKGILGKVRGGFEVTGKVMETALRRVLGIEK